MQMNSGARRAFTTSVSVFAMLASGSAYAQDSAQTIDEIDDGGSASNEIVVTAQRRAQSLQDVPIAVSAFSEETLKAQQIENSSDLQLTLPNVTFTKGNFTSASFTIRGIGDLCVGVSCDAATAIHLNGAPLFGTRLFETEFFDLERIEVLRGPQGTLFGRNATSGVVNLVTARPKTGEFEGSGEFEYGNFNAITAKGMVNIPIGESIAARVAGIYVKRDGYTTNLFDGSDVDDRDIYSIRGSLRWDIGPDTSLDLLASYFREDDNRSRIQKQLCERDETGILGCTPGGRDFDILNGNATFVGTLGSSEFLALQGIPAAFGLGSLYGPDPYSNFDQPDDVRTVNTDFTPEYFASEEQYQARFEHDFGPVALNVTGQYAKTEIDSRQDYNLSVQDRSVYATALNTLAAAAAGAIPGLPAEYFAPVANALIPNGPDGILCTSDTEETGTGIYGGFANCANTPLDYDRSNSTASAWSVEGILSTNFDGPLNLLVGGIYAESHLTENSYYVNAFGIDYISGVLGAFTALGAGLPPSYLGSPFFRNNTDDAELTSYGIFGEAYYEFNDDLKLTLGLRYNNDKKTIRARSALASFLVPHGTGNIFDSPFVGSFDADAGTEGNQLFQDRRGARAAKFDEITGRAVLDYKFADNSLVYFSYSRGYKSGGFNPPLQPIFEVAETFTPESIDAFEIGTKNSLLDGRLQLNATAFYYKYKDLQLSRIVARTSVNDNVDADIYGLELESIIEPTDGLVFNINASYLHTNVSSDKFLGNPRDPSGGRDDAVIIKDISNGSNCAVVSNAGSREAANAFVAGVNAGLGLQGPEALGGGIGATGAFSLCSILAANAGDNFTIENAGVPVNIRGNDLPQAPQYKFSVGAQYTIEMANDWTLVPRADLAYTGDSFGNIFNGEVNEFDGFAQVNAQITLNGADERFFVRGFVQNVFDSNSITGLYVTDQSSGLFTNIFTLEPRRYGIAAGFRF